MPARANTAWIGLSALFACLLFASAQGGSIDDEFAHQRARLVTLRLGFLEDQRVIDAMATVRRERYCLPEYREHAYEDRPLPIGHGQTISQPSLVAYMTEILALQPGERVLEIGTGSGYQAAILAQTGAQVFTIELLEALARRAEATLRAEGFRDIEVKHGDGYLGWPEHAPFDAIILTAAPPQVPPALLDQLKAGPGRLLVPEGPQGPAGQVLKLYRKDADGRVTTRSLLAVRFVPMVKGGKVNPR